MQVYVKIPVKIELNNAFFINSLINWRPTGQRDVTTKNY